MILKRFLFLLISVSGLAYLSIPFILIVLILTILNFCIFQLSGILVPSLLLLLNVTCLSLTKLNFPFENQIQNFLIPFSLSFYAFRVWSLYLDRKNNEIVETLSLIDFVSYLMFLPTFINGPFIDFNSYQEELKKKFKFMRIHEAFFLFIRGSFKKFVLSQNIYSLIVEINFSLHRSKGELLLALFMNVVYVTIDLSAYTDFARAFGKVLGCELPFNFNLSLLSTNIPQFWQRQHITFSQWLRKYIYYPIFFKVGEQVGALKGVLIAGLATFLVSGLWHVPGWGGIYFGLSHFVAYSLYRNNHSVSLKVVHFIGMWIVLMTSFWLIVHPQVNWVELFGQSVGRPFHNTATVKNAIFFLILFLFSEFFDWLHKRRQNFDLHGVAIVYHVIILVLVAMYYQAKTPQFLYFSF